MIHRHCCASQQWHPTGTDGNRIGKEDSQTAIRHGGVSERGLSEPRADAVRGAWVDEDESGEFVARLGAQLPTDALVVRGSLFGVGLRSNEATTEYS